MVDHLYGFGKLIFGSLKKAKSNFFCFAQKANEISASRKKKQKASFFAVCRQSKANEPPKKQAKSKRKTRLLAEP